MTRGTNITPKKGADESELVAACWGALLLLILAGIASYKSGLHWVVIALISAAYIAGCYFAYQLGKKQ